MGEGERRNRTNYTQRNGYASEQHSFEPAAVAIDLITQFCQLAHVVGRFLHQWSSCKLGTRAYRKRIIDFLFYFLSGAPFSRY
jgi:hypothetical protein